MVFLNPSSLISIKRELALSLERGIGNPFPGLPSPVSRLQKKTTPSGMVFLIVMKRYELPELIRYSKSPPGVLPGDIQVRAQDPAGAAFHAALYSDLHGASVLGPVGTNGAEIDAGLILASHTDLGIDDGQVQFLFIGEIFQRHQLSATSTYRRYILREALFFVFSFPF